MEKSDFFEVGAQIFIKASDVKIIADAKNKAVNRMLAPIRVVGAVYNAVPQSGSRKSVVFMNDGSAYLSGFLPERIAARAEEAGQRLSKVGSGFYIPVSGIAGVYGFKSSLATRMRRDRPDTADISLVRGAKQRKSTILLRSGETVSVACVPKKVCGLDIKPGVAGTEEPERTEGEMEHTVSGPKPEKASQEETAKAA